MPCFRFLITALILLSLIACHAPETRSLLGQSLHAPELSDDVRMKREAALDQARTIYSVHPKSEDAVIWLGRRTAYLGRYREAVEIYTAGLEVFPESHRLLRHRGHRYITLRELDAALDDLEEADRLSLDKPNAIEPDGMPNAEGRPRSTTKGNILYHLALARYLKGDFKGAMIDFQRSLALADNDDMRVAAAYWVYLSARRAGDDTAADEAMAVATPDMDLLENHTYHALLLEFQQLDAATPPESHLDDGVDEATTGYGMAMQVFLAGNTDDARDRLQAIVDSTNWAAFGHIAAEADMARFEEIR